MSFKTAVDVPLIVRSENSNIERRISPAWTISHLKSRMESITGIPASSQTLTLDIATSQAKIVLEAADEDSTQLSVFPLQAYAELHVHDSRPAAVRSINTFNDLSSVERYVMAPETYEALPETVLSYKRNKQIGRFDPAAPTILAQQSAAHVAEVSARGIEVGKRCRLLPAHTDDRRGEIQHIGEVEGLPGHGPWIGVALDEPTGRNDGSGPSGKKYFTCGKNYGVFVRPERIEMGQFETVDELVEEDELDERMEEI